MSIAVPLEKLLNSLIKQDDTWGIFVEQIVVLFRFSLQQAKNEITLNVGAIVPLVEMYLLTHEFVYRLENRGRRTLIRGIAFTNPQAIELFELLTTGLVSASSMEKANKLSADVFKNVEV